MTWDIIIITAIMLIAILLFLAEIFLLPGLSIAGIAGVLFAIAGVVYAYTINITTGHITLGGSVFVFGGLFLWLLRAKSFQRVALKTDVDSTLTSTRDLNLRIGDEGVTLSRLAPIGKARFGQTIVEAKAQDSFIDEQTPIEIIRINGYNVIVQLIRSQDSH